MTTELTEKDIRDGKKLAEIFSNLSDEAQLMVMSYLSALRDKERADMCKSFCENNIA